MSFLSYYLVKYCDYIVNHSTGIYIYIYICVNRPSAAILAQMASTHRYGTPTGHGDNVVTGLGPTSQYNKVILS